MIDQSTRETIYKFIRANYKSMTIEQIQDALRKVILMDLHRNTVQKLIYEAVGAEDKNPMKSGRPKKLR
jgi:transposase